MEIEVSNLSKQIRGITILDRITLHFESGNIYGIIGQNGSGKTMLLRAIAGLIIPSEGTIMVDGKILGKDISFPQDIGILIERPEFLGYLSGLENLKLLAEIKGMISDENIKKYMEWFDLDPLSKKSVRKYSLGMKQKLGIIQAIMENQQLLVLDEPFNALDEKSVDKFRTLLLDYKDEGRLIILTSHHKEDISSLCDYTYRLEEGRILSE
ncbi:MAG: ATP-binding cassette domain-containing protein [Acetatifactor sp.]|nr:ATP-binding cassette domain-containing protein [Acetatifactor sp.]